LPTGVDVRGGRLISVLALGLTVQLGVEVLVEFFVERLLELTSLSFVLLLEEKLLLRLGALDVVLLVISVLVVVLVGVLVLVFFERLDEVLSIVGTRDYDRQNLFRVVAAALRAR